MEKGSLASIRRWENSLRGTRTDRQRRIGLRDRRKRLTPELNGEFIKGTYVHEQSLGQQDGGSPHGKGMETRYISNTGGL